jgi:hypothetical protein
MNEVGDWKKLKHYGKKYLKNEVFNMDAGEVSRKN